MNPFRERTVRLIVFDLDGTLLDSLPVIAGSVNEVRARHGAPPHSEEFVRGAIGEGARVLTERTLTDLVDPLLSMQTLFDEYMAIYLPASVRDARLFEGVAACLPVARAGRELAILTNKPLAITNAIVEVLGWRKLFTAVVAPENARARKPDPAGLLGLIEDLAMKREEAILIGDSVHDFATGKGAGVFTIGMRSGYYVPGEPPPDLWVEDFSELKRLLEESRAAA